MSDVRRTGPTRQHVGPTPPTLRSYLADHGRPIIRIVRPRISEVKRKTVAKIFLSRWYTGCNADARCYGR